MPAFVGHEPAPDRTADQVQVADEIQNLVPGAFVGQSEAVFQRPFFADYQQVFWCQMLTESAAAQLLHFTLKDERSRRRELMRKIVIAEVKRDCLATDGLGRLEVVNDFQPVRRTRKRR